MGREGLEWGGGRGKFRRRAGDESHIFFTVFVEEISRLKVKHFLWLCVEGVVKF